MKRQFRHLLSPQTATDPLRRRRGSTKVALWLGLLLLSCGLSLSLTLGWFLPTVQAQSPAASSTRSPTTPEATPASPAAPTRPQRQLQLANLPPAPLVAADKPGQYVIEFNRSPIIGNRFRFDGIYDEARLQFTRPRNWEAKSVKVALRFRHSSALFATRSNLTVIVNGTSVGSVPLNKKQGEIGNVVFDIPLNLIRDYNELLVAVLQNNSPTCTQDPYDPSLWSEVLPDSKIVFEYTPQPITLDFKRYPYPIYDELSLEANQIAYLKPPDATDIEETWLTATSRFQMALGRIADYRALDSRIIETVEDLQKNERLLVIGTPKTQPVLKTLKLPVAIASDRFLDSKKEPLPDDVGVLILTAAKNNTAPTLVATGNSMAGVEKAVQFLAQGRDRQLGTGQVILVDQVRQVASPPIRAWEGYLPLENSFLLQDLKTYGGQAIADTTVRGSHSPALEFDFKALPDDQFEPGSTVNLRYSYSPQINPLTSLVEVMVDHVAIGGSRLTSIDGAKHQSLKVEIPADRVTPQSKMQINFRLDPRERRSCSRVTDQQLWGTIHADSSFALKRENIARLPDLKLLRTGYPFAAPQDFSQTDIVMPNSPSVPELELMLEFAERMGRLSKAESVQLQTYRAAKLPMEQRNSHHLVGIGIRNQFPFPEAFEPIKGFALKGALSRQWGDSQVQVFPDADGLLKQVLSPWNNQRALLVLSSQTETGLMQLRDLFAQDSLFHQIEGDTVLISANEPNPSPYDPDAYSFEFLQESPQKDVVAVNPRGRFLKRLASSWVVVAPGMLIASLVLYGMIQAYLKRLALESNKN
jgi:hypothetical protein